MSVRLPTHILVGGLIRRVQEAGGFAAVLARGDRESGAVLLVCVERGGAPKLLERALGPDGKPALIPAGPKDSPAPAELDDYWQRRRARDPDLWVVELDVAGAERFAAETMSLN